MNVISNVKSNVVDNCISNLIGSSVPTATITTTQINWVSLWRGLSGSNLTFKWGDGNQTTIELLGTGTSVNANYNYPDSTEKTITIIGDLDSVNWMQIGAQNVTTFNISYLSALQVARLYSNPNMVDISSVSELANLTYVTISSCGVTDIAPIAVGTYQFIATGNPLVYTTLTWGQRTSGNILLDSCFSTSGEVDQVLIDLAAANWSNCTIYLDGTNPARTSASDAAFAQLVLAGCTIHLS